MREKTSDKQGLHDLIDSLSADNLFMVEAGSHAGESAEIFLSTGKVANIVCIDPWTTIVESEAGNTYTNMERVERLFDDRMRQYDGKFVKFKGTYDEYVKSLTPDSARPDLVYIDAIHTYEACSADIKATLETVRPKLAIAGHDYADQPHHIIGVKKAVNEAFGKPDAVFCDTSWIKFLN